MASDELHNQSTDIKTQIATMPLLDHRSVDWKRVQRTAYLLHQQLRYDYPGPIHDLQQRLMLLPPERYGDQRRVVYRLEVSAEQNTVRTYSDDFGNCVIAVHVPEVAQSIEFETWIVVERSANYGPHYVPATLLSAPYCREVSALTQPDETLRQIAAELQAKPVQEEEIAGLTLARRINERVYKAFSYAHDVTSIHTTAAQAWALKRGVCQDYSHVMLALCRLCGLAARYVSGHLLGEGGTHAWVEVLLPAPGRPAEAIAWPFDPTHGDEASLNYLTIAVGRDYYDVAPTSGTYRAPYAGQLSAHKRVDLTELEYTP